MSISSLTVLQQAFGKISWTFYYLYYEIPRLAGLFREIRDVYDGDVAESKMKDGEVAYPAGSSTRSNLGMQIEFR